MPTTPARSGSSGTAGRSGATRSRRSSPATTSRTAGSTSSATTRPDDSTSSPRPIADDLPLVLVPDGETLRAPTILELADALGLRTSAEQPLYDLCIVGGGPAGLAAAVYGASEGLQTVVIEREAPGRPGRPERRHRELPRVPEGPVRRRAHPPRRRPGAPVRRRDGPGPRRRRASRCAARCAPCASPTEPRSRRGRCWSPPACRTGCSDAPGLAERHRPRRVLRRDRQRRASRARATTCTSSARPTRPARRR